MKIPNKIIYFIFSELIFSISMPLNLNADQGLVIYHGHGLVIHERTKIGKYVTLRHNTTIGLKTLDDSGDAPILCDNVNVGANTVILGGVTIGENVIIGAGSVVICDIAPNSLAAGNPAKLIRTLKP